MNVGPGVRLGRYQIVEEISRGGMGVVYRALDADLSREIALKVLPADLVGNVDRRDRFLQEARAASALEHPNIAVIHEVAEADGVSFIAMELIRGDKLSDLLARGPMPVGRSLELAVEIAEALGRAHDRGVIHRDLKPANVMVTEQGHAKIIDFGLAKLIAPLAGDAAGDTTVAGDTDPGTVLGTVSYMSPEQATGSRIDHRTDIFSFGIVLHEMLAGRPPFRGPSGVETLHSILHAPPPPLPPLGAQVSPLAAADIQRVRDKCLEKAPEDRYQGMRDVVVDLRAARRRLESAPMSAVGTPAVRRLRWWAAAAAVGILAAVGITVQQWPAPEPRQTSKPSVAVLHFENNTGNASLDWLRTGLTDMLVTDLSQSPDIEVLGTDRLQQILTELKRDDDRSVSFEVVQELARRAGVKTVLVGSYVKSGDAIRINVRLQDASDGRIVTAERVEALGESNLFPIVDDLTRRLKAKLALPTPQGQAVGLLARPTPATVSTPEIDRDLRDVTTSSIEAYRYYAEGVNLHERLRDAESIPLFERALATDPNFALAMAKLAVVHGNLNHPAESAEYAKRAFEHRDRVTARERAYIEGEYLNDRQETVAQAIDVFERGLKVYPDHASIRNNLALIYQQLERRDEAARHYEELRLRGMTFAGSFGGLSGIYTARGEFDKAIQVVEEYLHRFPDVPQAYGYLGGVYVASGKLEEAAKAYERALALDPALTIGLVGKWNLHVLGGRWKDAEALATRLTASADPFVRFTGHMQWSTLHLYHGRSGAALASLDRASQAYGRPVTTTALARVRATSVLLARNNPSAALAQALKARNEAADAAPAWPALHALALAQAAAGRPVDAAATLEELRRRAAQLPSERELRRGHQLAEELALARRDYTAAVADALEAHKRLPAYFIGGPGGTATSVAAQIWFTLASGLFLSGRMDEAEAWLGRIVDGRHERLNAPMEYVRSLYLLGRVYEHRHDLTRARDCYGRFVELWRGGDLDRDRVADAERRLRSATTN